MTQPDKTEADWSVATWKGARRRQHQEFYALPFSRKLEIVEEMNRFALAALGKRRARGLAYLEPYSCEVVPARVGEEPPSRGNS